MTEPSGTTSSFSRSSTTYYATATRVALLLLSLWKGSDLYSWIQNPIFTSILADPVFTVDHVREAMAIIQTLASSGESSSSFANAYMFTNSIHLPPLLLALCESLFKYLSRIIVSLPLQQLTVGLLLMGIDFLVARSLETVALAAIYRLGEENQWEDSLQEYIPECLQAPLSHVFEVQELKQETTKRSSSDADGEETPPIRTMIRSLQIPTLVAQLYYCSPITILTSLCGCFTSLQTLLLLQATIQAALSTGSIVLAMLYLSMATYVNVHFAVFIIPIILLHQRQSSSPRQPIRILLSWWVLFSLALQGLSFLLIGSSHRFRQVVAITHFHSFSLLHLRPSLSTLWYLSMELFGRFRLYFVYLLGGLPYSLVAPMAIRLHRYPYVLIAIYWTLGTLFRPPGTLYSLNVALCLTFLNLRSLAHMHKTLTVVALCALPVPVILYVVCYWLWLERGSGEANFVYFQCLAYNVFVGLLLVEFGSASLRRDKILRVVEKQRQITSEKTRQ